MASRLEHYAFLGNQRGSALVSREGSVDWLCIPRFDSEACMAALVGRDENGCWLIHPSAGARRIERRYRPGTLILETDFHCDGGTVRVTDFMPVRSDTHSILRVVEGLAGTVQMDVNVKIRPGYGRYRPWISRGDDADAFEFVVPPDAFTLRVPASPVPLHVEDHHIRATLAVKKGDFVPFELSWHGAYDEPAPAVDIRKALSDTEAGWTEWADRSQYRGLYKEAVDRSLILLRGMIYQPTGAIVAAPTAGLPEQLGGPRNWDYRYCWLRDATLTLDALMVGGYREEAKAFRSWLFKSVAGAPDELQIMYGVEGERRLNESELPWLSGYDESRPVRIGNAASDQFQLDVYGEVVQCLYEARRIGVPEGRFGHGPEIEFMQFLESAWQRPDHGLWEMRGQARHFVESKVMAWVAFERAARFYEDFTDKGDPLRRYVPGFRATAERIRREVCEQGFDRVRKTFVQAYGRPALDAAVLRIPALGFLPANDPRVAGTIAAVERELVRDGLVLRYDSDETKDGFSGNEGAFLACCFWLVDAYAYAGRRRDAETLFERLLGLRSELGLLSEEYDPVAGRLVGNYPQAFSHLALVHSASVLSDAEQTPRARADGSAPGAH